MGNSFRLKSSTMFSRPEEENKEEPLKIAFLSVEGNKTEQQYFDFIEKYRIQLGIKPIVHIHSLRRAKNDTLSAPEDVLELLDEYMELRDAKILPERMRAFIPQTYTDQFIKNYLEGKEIDLEMKQNFETLLHQSGIDLIYNHFLHNISGTDDIFGIVIDRDCGCHSISQLDSIVEQCNQKNYHCFITNPCIEFWLLLHLTDIKQQYPEDLPKFLQNEKVSAKHTFTSKKVSEIAGHTKGISETTFQTLYLPKIDFAIEQTETEFATELKELIGNIENANGKLGSNLPQLFSILREI